MSEKGDVVSEPKMPPEAEREWLEEERRHIRAISAWLQRWPNFRQTAAYGQLGGAVAFADMMGIDADDFLRKLRAQGLDRSTSGVLWPPRSS